MNRDRRHTIAWAIAWAVCSALYILTARSAPDLFGPDFDHHYEYLVDGFLGGHLYLSVTPSPRLLALPDPYDPTQNAPDRLHDASLYHGRYYLYFGPTPALLLMLPWKVATGVHLPQWLATAVFASGGLAALALLMSGLQQRLFPALRAFHLFLAVLLLGHVSWLPVVLRRSEVWELPIVAAAALLWWSLYFLWKYQDSGGGVRRAVAGGVALAFLIGARPTYVFTAAFIALLYALPFDHARPIASWLRRLLPAGLPLAAGIAGLLLYNYLRFGALFEFGEHYQLAAQDVRGILSFRLANIPFHVWLYLFSLPGVGVYFPFFHSAWVAALPAKYTGIEEMQGILFSMPVHVLGAIALISAFRRRFGATYPPVKFLLLASCGASLLVGSVLFCFPGAASRYFVELLAGWCVATGIGFFTVFSRREPTLRRNVYQLLVLVISAWAVYYVWMASFDYRRVAIRGGRIACPLIAEALNYPSFWLARCSGQRFGPVELEIHLPAAPSTGAVALLSAGSADRRSSLIIDRITPTECHLLFSVNSQIYATPVLHLNGPTLRVTCSAPWLYPPPVHPYWRTACTDEQERQRRQTLYSIEVNGSVFAWRSSSEFDATHFDPDVCTAAFEPRGCAWVTSWSHVDPSLRPSDSPVSPPPGGSTP
jgi:hypothetical protein